MFVLIQNKPATEGEWPQVLIERKEGVPELEELQAAVGGWVDATTLADLGNGRELTAWVNDEGLLIGLPILQILNPPAYRGPANLAGNVVLAITDMKTGETVPMTEEEAGLISFGGRWLLNFQTGQMVPLLSYTGSN